MPMYNNGRIVNRTIKSVIKQTLSDWELICVDDCSTDNTPHIARRWQERDPDRIHIIKLNKNRGPLAARIAGLHKSQGEYIAFLDAGDCLNKQGLQSMLAVAKATDADIVHGGTCLCIPSLPFKQTYSLPRTSYLDKYPEEKGTTDNTYNIYKSLLKGELSINVFDKLYRASLVKSIHLPDCDLRIAEDILFNCCIYPYAQRISLTDIDYYSWNYSGMHSKYYLHHYKENLNAAEIIFKQLADTATSLNTNNAELSRCFATNFMKMIEFGAAEHIIARKDISEYCSDILCSQAMQITKLNLRNYRDKSLKELTVEDILQFGRQQLQEHRKYYIFTRILNFIYRI